MKYGGAVLTARVITIQGSMIMCALIVINYSMEILKKVVFLYYGVEIANKTHQRR